MNAIAVVMLNARRLVVGLFLCFSLPAFAQASWHASTLPSDGAIMGSPETSVGWGYSISNSSANWLVMTGVTASGFAYAVPYVLFDFPIVRPFSFIDQPYSGSTGLYSVSWASNVNAGSIDVGFFTITAEWWIGDPLDGGSYFAVADSVLLPYSASVSVVPEVPVAICLLLGLSATAAFTRRRGVKERAVPMPLLA